MSVIVTVCAPAYVPPPGEKDGASALMVTASVATALGLKLAPPAIALIVVGTLTGIAPEYVEPR